MSSSEHCCAVSFQGSRHPLGHDGTIFHPFHGALVASELFSFSHRSPEQSYKLSNLRFSTCQASHQQLISQIMYSATVESEQRRIYALSSILTAVASIAVALRLLSKKVVKASYAADDWWIMASLVGQYAESAVLIWGG